MIKTFNLSPVGLLLETNACTHAHQEWGLGEGGGGGGGGGGGAKRTVRNKGDMRVCNDKQMCIAMAIT